MQPTIKIHDDGKGKHMSVEAYLDQHGFGFGGELAPTIDIAVENLKKEVAARIEVLQNLDYSNIVMVDCYGETIFDR